MTDDTVSEAIEIWSSVVADLYGGVSANRSDSRAAGEAAACLWSGAGRLDAPTAVARLICQAIETGYLAALSDVRAGKIDLA
jgi:hypothetical protein